MASVPLSTPSSNIFSFSNTLNLILWSGCINRHGNILELVNTCPLDNFLMVFDYLFYLRKTDIDLLPDPLPATFSEINKFLIDAEFGEAKMKQLETLRVVPPVVNGKIDVFGSENRRFISGLLKLLANTVTSTCSEPNCPKATINMKSYSIELGMLPRSQYVNTQMYFRSCAVQWFENNSVSKCMWKSNSGVVCSGTRNSSNRRFDNGFPLILLFNIDLLTANKTLNTDLTVNNL